MANRIHGILDAARAVSNDNPLVFPSGRGKRLNDMALSGLLKTLEIPAVPHGFRSTFRDWAPRRRTTHARWSRRRWPTSSRTKVEAAYARSDLFERRRRLMNDWASA